MSQIQSGEIKRLLNSIYSLNSAETQKKQPDHVVTTTMKTMTTTLGAKKKKLVSIIGNFG